MWRVAVLLVLVVWACSTSDERAGQNTATPPSTIELSVSEPATSPQSEDSEGREKSGFDPRMITSPAPVDFPRFVMPSAATHSYALGDRFVELVITRQNEAATLQLWAEAARIFGGPELTLTLDRQVVLLGSVGDVQCPPATVWIDFTITLFGAGDAECSPLFRGSFAGRGVARVDGREVDVVTVVLHDQERGTRTVMDVAMQLGVPLRIEAASEAGAWTAELRQ